MLEEHVDAERVFQYNRTSYYYETRKKLFTLRVQMQRWYWCPWGFNGECKSSCKKPANTKRPYGYRSLEYNTKIKGAKRSQHMVAKAADIIVPGMTSLEVRDIILELIREGKMEKGGVGIYPTFVHYDVRGYNARWGSYNRWKQ